MSNIDKRALRKAAIHAKTVDDWGCDADNFHEKATPDAVLALLDELEAKEEQRANWFQMAQKLGDDLDAAEKRNAELTDDCWIYEGTVKKLLERAEAAESACSEAACILESGERMALTRSVEILRAAAAGKGEAS